MFKDLKCLLEKIKQDQSLLDALDGIEDISSHLKPMVEAFLVENCQFKIPTRDYEKVQFLFEQRDVFELVQYHVRLEPKGKSSYRTSKYNLSGDWTTIAQVIIDNNLNIKNVIMLSREIIEKNNNNKPWTIGKCLKLGTILYSAHDKELH